MLTCVASRISHVLLYFLYLICVISVFLCEPIRGDMYVTGHLTHAQVLLNAHSGCLMVNYSFRDIISLSLDKRDSVQCIYSLVQIILLN